MQAARVILEQYGNDRIVEPNGLTAQFSNWLTRVFGCWHGEMSRPFTVEDKSYRSCLQCGAQRDFDPVKWEMVGSFYYDSPQNRLTPRRTTSVVVHRRPRLRLASGARSNA